MKAKLELGEHAVRAFAADEERNEIEPVRPAAKPDDFSRAEHALRGRHHVLDLFRNGPSTVRLRAPQPSRRRSSKECSTESDPT